MIFVHLCMSFLDPYLFNISLEIDELFDLIHLVSKETSHLEMLNQCPVQKQKIVLKIDMMKTKEHY